MNTKLVRNIVTEETYEAYFTRFYPGKGIVDLPLLVRVSDGRHLDITRHVIAQRLRPKAED